MRAPAFRAGVAAMVLLLLTACREGVSPFTPPPTTPADTDPRQLTFGIGDERDPQWSADGDSIYFHSNAWYHAPGPGTLLRISAEGGSATQLADYAQPNAATFLTGPTAARAGSQLAYLHVVRIRGAAACATFNNQDPPERCTVPEPVLDSAVLRLRASTAVNPAITDPGLAIRYPGLDPDQWRSAEPPFQQRVYPFHLDWLREDESAALRPTWAPDGTRLAFSDGIGLYTWTPGAATASVIPGTTDGVAPAWSPDGNWIAFTIIERGDSSVVECLCGPRLDMAHLRTWWIVAGYRLAIIRPDGSGRSVLGEGRDPAWSPDSRSLYVRRGGAGNESIFRVPVESAGTAEPVPGTAGGRTPSVSPDGNWLAFTRRKQGGTGDLDLWIKSLVK